MSLRNAFDEVATETTAAATRAAVEALKNPATSATTVSGTREKFRDGFTSGLNSSVWFSVNDTPDSSTNGQGHIVAAGGDSQGSAYLRISLSPFVAGSGVQLSSKQSFDLPLRHAWGISTSQRVLGQEIIFGLAEALDSDLTLGLNKLSQPADLAISGTVSITSNVATIAFASAHGLKGNDRVIVFGNTKKELNVGPVYVTVVDAVTITVPCTLANGTYTAGGSVRVADPLGLSNNAAMQVWADNTTTTNSTYASRRAGTKYRTLTSQGTLSSAPLQINTVNYSDAWLSQGPYEIWANLDEVVWKSWADGVNANTGYGKFQQSIPDDSVKYRMYVRAKNLDNFSRPIARITSIVKTASTTATVTTDVAHGLSVGDTVGVTGVRDQTNFAQMSSGAVASVPTSTTFTVSFGVSATATDTNGGVVWLDNGSSNTPGLTTNGAIQSVASTTANILSVVTNGTMTGASVGDLVQLYGLVSGQQTYEGAYRLLRINGTTVELAPVATTWNGATFSSQTTGGQVIRRTDVRLHFARILGHTRLMTEVVGGRGGTTDGNNTVPVSVVNSSTITVNAIPLVALTETNTSTTLGASATFTEATTDTGASANARHGFNRVSVAHTAGNTHGHLVLEESIDNFSTTRETFRVPVPSDGVFHVFDIPVSMRYNRVKFINGSVAQTAFGCNVARYRGEGSTFTTRPLQMQLTPVAGQSLGISTTFTSPNLDLGVNPQYTLARLLASSDQASAANGISIQQSMDGSTGWFSVSTTANTAGNSAYVEEKIICRFLRVNYVNSTVAATTLRLNLTLVAA